MTVRIPTTEGELQDLVRGRRVELIETSDPAHAELVGRTGVLLRVVPSPRRGRPYALLARFGRREVLLHLGEDALRSVD